MTASGLDPITVDITRYKLDGIANEMQATRSTARPWRKAARSRSISRP
jgi:hypothetical protein